MDIIWIIQNGDKIASEIAQSVNAKVQTPNKMIVDLSALSDWMNIPMYDWYKLPDDEAYKSLPAFRYKFEKYTACFPCAGMALFVELICPKIKDATQRDYYKDSFCRGYEQGLVDFENQYNMRCSNDMAPTLIEKKAILFSYYSELREQYRNTIGFSADLIEKMGYNSGLMFSVAHKLRLMDKALAATKHLIPTENQKKRDSCSNKPLEDFIIKDREKVLHFIDSELSVCSKPQGKLVAMIIVVLYKAGYIVEINGKLKAIHNALKDKYPSKIGNLQGIVDYANSYCKEDYSGDKKITNDELESLRKKLE